MPYRSLRGSIQEGERNHLTARLPPAPLRAPFKARRKKKSKYRTKLCRNLELGNCAYGNRCRFFHPLNVSIPRHNSASPFLPTLPLYLPADSLYHPWAARDQPLPHVPFDGSFSVNDFEKRDIGQSYDPAGNESSRQPVAPKYHMAMPLMRPFSWKTAPCRHFVRHQGWCPLGDRCNFIHDLSLPSNPAVEDYRPAPVTTSKEPALFEENPNDDNSARIISGGVIMGSRPAPCWRHVQGIGCRLRYCKYMHPKDVQPYIKYTPCPGWPRCLGDTCEFQHHAQMPLMYQLYPIVPAPVFRNGDAGLMPYTTIEVKGTTYFCALPVPQQDIAPEYHDDLFESPAPGYFDQLTGWYSSGQATPSPTSGEQPPRTGHFAGRSFEDIQASRAASKVTSKVEADAEVGDGPLTSTGVGMFPYRADKTQRSGHARRISIVANGKENVTTGVGTVKHKGHTSHKSWSSFSAVERHALSERVA